MSKSLDEYSREELIEEVRRLKKQKKFGLVWENKPEKVVEDCETKLPVVEEVAEKAIEGAPGEPANIIIEGDNYHALSVLNYTHANSIDVIYIDPPYNTGNKDFIYNDCYVDKEDTFRHSKWLSFMEKRLRLAKNLLADDGVIFISIDENEQANLKCLCDSVFGENNYIENFIWIKNSTKNLSRTTSTNHEYVLCYARSIKAVSENDELFRIQKNGLPAIKELLRSDEEDGKSLNEIEVDLKRYYRDHPELKGISSYNRVDYRKSDGKMMAYTLDNTAAPKASGKSDTYDIIHPVDNKPCKCPVTGWRYKKETMQQHIENGLIEFYEDHTHVPRFKRYLDTVETEVQRSLITDFTDGKKETMKIFNGDSPFENPKPTTLIKKLMNCFGSNITILDFFAGSGTTGQAVMGLNKEDGGHRQFILVTNNESKGKTDAGAEGIAEKVTYPRIKTVITGIRPDGSNYSDGIPANLRYFKTDFVEKGKTTDDTREALVTKCSDMIRIRENAFEYVASTPEYRFYKNDRVFVPIIFDQFAIAETWEKVEELNTAGLPVHCYNFSYTRHANEEEIPEDTKLEWTACSIPETVLEVYRKIFRKKEV